MEKEKVYKWASGKSTFIISVFLTESFEAGKISNCFEAQKIFHLCVCVWVCVCMCVTLSWDSFSCHLFGFSANNEIIMRSLMGLKKKRKNTSHELSVSPSLSCLSVKSILHIRSLSLDLRQNWKRPEVGGAPSVLSGDQDARVCWVENALFSSTSQTCFSLDPVTPILNASNFGERMKASIRSFCRLDVQFVWSAHSPYPAPFNPEHSWLGLVRRDGISVLIGRSRVFWNPGKTLVRMNHFW